MKIFFIVAFLFQGLCSSYCHAVYLISRGGNHLAEVEEWKDIQENIHKQVWVERKSQSDLILPDGVESLFVPDSLMQAFALDMLHQMLRANVKKQLSDTNIDDGYIDLEGIPFKFIFSEYDTSCAKNPEINKKVTEVFEAEQKQMIRRMFRREGLDQSFIDIINQTQLSSSSGSGEDNLEKENWTPPVLDDAIKYFLDINFISNQFTQYRLKTQYTIEKLFFQKYQEMIKGKRWIGILNDFYAPISREKSPHFINISYTALTEDGFMMRFLEDHENLSISIMFEEECENNNTVALFRGDGSRDSRATNEHYGTPNKRASISLGRGYYSGIFKDAHASIAYRSSKHRYFLGLVSLKQIFTDLMVIPPLSWYQNLGLGGELWHPRTTVAISTPLGARDTELSIEGINILRPIDKLGILVKEGDTQSHFQKVQGMLENSKILKENSLL